MRKIRNIDTHTLFSLSMLAFCLLMLPVLNSKPDVNVDFSQRWLLIGIAQCLIIKLAPLLLHVRIFRKWFGWCDAFSLTQKQWFDSRQTRKFIVSLDHDYFQTVIPPFLIELMGRKSKALLLFKNRWTTIY